MVFRTLPPGMPGRFPGYDLTRLVLADAGEPDTHAKVLPEPEMSEAGLGMLADFAAETARNGWLTMEPVPNDHPLAGAPLIEEPRAGRAHRGGTAPRGKTPGGAGAGTTGSMDVGPGRRRWVGIGRQVRDRTFQYRM
ncbi:hypothetical protein AB0M79_25405 [Polymorphospora sp. NPDC051019]|uniref:hypothetical protein n=1 Tax=Polymorphospora sp. NPDC051019 TaxID=3155725 RepID=UPI003447BD95